MLNSGEEWQICKGPLGEKHQKSTCVSVSENYLLFLFFNNKNEIEFID